VTRTQSILLTIAVEVGLTTVLFAIGLTHDWSNGALGVSAMGAVAIGSAILGLTLPHNEPRSGRRV